MASTVEGLKAIASSVQVRPHLNDLTFLSNGGWPTVLFGSTFQLLEAGCVLALLYE